MPTAGNTNSGRTDAKGRTIWNGPRGGRFVRGPTGNKIPVNKGDKTFTPLRHAGAAIIGPTARDLTNEEWEAEQRNWEQAERRRQAARDKRKKKQKLCPPC
jgi:hypothetical protein